MMFAGGMAGGGLTQMHVVPSANMPMASSPVQPSPMAGLTPQQQQYAAAQQAQLQAQVQAHAQAQAPQQPVSMDGVMSQHSMQQPKSPQVPATLEECQRLLDEIYDYKQQQKDQLENIRQYQKQVMIRPQKEGYDVLLQQHKQLRNQITEELRMLQALFQQVILPPAEIHKLIYLLQDLKLQQIQLELFQQELQRLTLAPQHPHLARPYVPYPPSSPARGRKAFVMRV